MIEFLTSTAFLAAVAYVLAALSCTYALFVFYAAVMNIKRVRDQGKLSWFGKVLGYPTLLVGLVLDLIVNVLVMTVLLLELPQELTVTSRLKRHKRDGSGWRLSVVLFFEPVLNPLDPSGVHI
jgi:uncharacterized membrane protein YhaH (DUF805 family)